VGFAVDPELALISVWESELHSDGIPLLGPDWYDEGSSKFMGDGLALMSRLSESAEECSVRKQGHPIVQHECI